MIGIVWIICSCLNVVNVGFQKEEAELGDVLFAFVFGPIYTLFLLGTLIRLVCHK